MKTYQQNLSVILMMVGTSLSNTALAAYWTKNYKGSFKDTYDYLKSIGKPVLADPTGLFVDVTK